MSAYPMQLDPAAYDFYWKKGWLVVEGVFSPDVMEQIGETALRLAEQASDDSGYLKDREGDQTAPRKIDKPFLKDPAFRKLALDPRLVGLIEQLLKVHPVLATDQVFMKPPRLGSEKPYHQDNFYFRCTPADHVITAWIALDNATVANGCLRYIDGSHRGPLLPHSAVPERPYDQTPPAGMIDLSRQSSAEVRKGGVVFHHSMTLHTSHRNESPHWRKGYATHWASRETTATSDFIRNAYFNRAELMTQEV